MRMKKSLCLLLVMLCSVSLFACGSSSDASTQTEDAEGTSEAEEEEETSSDSESTKAQEDWSDSEIASYMPRPDSEHVEVDRDEDDYFSFTVSEATQSDFEDYIGSCEYMGFTKDVEEDGNHYAASLDGGDYEIDITYTASTESYEGYIVPKK